MGFTKFVNVHEIICHYSCTKIHFKGKEIPLSTPEKTFIGFKPMKRYTDLIKIYAGVDKKNNILSFRIGSLSDNKNLLNEYYEIGVSYFETCNHILQIMEKF